MDSISCDECRTFYREFMEAYRAIGRFGPRGPIRYGDSEQSTEWVHRIDELRATRMNEGPRFMDTYHRFLEHHKRTGHRLPLPQIDIPPEAWTSPN